jgi:hypothetical protein
MLMSVDGKITDGATDNLDFDQDFPEIAGVREGLQQSTIFRRQQISGRSIPAEYRPRLA